jgi:voltage-gated potassium channel
MTARRPTTLRRNIYRLLAGPGHFGRWSYAVDRFLLLLIIVNSLLSAMETVDHLTILHGAYFHLFDWCSVGVFSVEYVLRVWTAVEEPNPRFRHPLWGRLRFMMSPLALVDLLAVFPFYFRSFLGLDTRSIRVLRLLRILKLTRHSDAMSVMAATLRRESDALGAVLFVFLVLMIVVASLVYLVEHPAQPQIFRDVPTCLWWAVVTMTTVGYGDMVPITAWGRVIGGCTAIAGLAMIALPAGILASGFSEQLRLRREAFQDDVEYVVEGGPLTAKARRHLEEAREELQLSHEDAARILRHAVSAGGHAVCPHCGEKIEAGNGHG